MTIGGIVRGSGGKVFRRVDRRLAISILPIPLRGRGLVGGCQRGYARLHGGTVETTDEAELFFDIRIVEMP